jgi:hypothetical protein
MKILLLAGITAAALSATPASATDFSFAGTLNDPNQVLFFDFTVSDTSTVTLRSYSYAGGVNAAGQTIDRSGFDPILGVYDATGAKIGENDDGGFNVPADTDRNRYETYFQAALTPGTYKAAVSVYSNFGPDNLNTGVFRNTGSFGSRTANFAFDVLNVNTAVGPGAVPEPATWAMMVIGFAGAGLALRSRRKVTVSYAR